MEKSSIYKYELTSILINKKKKLENRSLLFLD